MSPLNGNRKNIRICKTNDIESLEILDIYNPTYYVTSLMEEFLQNDENHDKKYLIIKNLIVYEDYKYEEMELYFNVFFNNWDKKTKLCSNSKCFVHKTSLVVLF